MAIKTTIFLHWRLFKVSHMKYEFNIQTGHLSVGVGVSFWGDSHLQHMGGFNILSATTGDVSIIPSIRIWGYVLHVERVSCVMTNCGQHHWVIPSRFLITLEALREENITRRLLNQCLKLLFKILPFEDAFLILFVICIISMYFLLVGLLLG